MATWTALTHTAGREAAEALAELGEDLTPEPVGSGAFRRRKAASVPACEYSSWAPPPSWVLAPALTVLQLGLSYCQKVRRVLASDWLPMQWWAVKYHGIWVPGSLSCRAVPVQV